MSLRATQVEAQPESYGLTPLPPHRDPPTNASTPEPQEENNPRQAWTVLAGCSVVAWWMIGIPYSWGVLESALVEHGVGTAAVLSFVGSLAAALVSAFAIINSRIMRRLGTRWTGIIGITLMGLSGIISSFAFNNIGALFASSGVVLGLGISLCFSTVSVAPAQYFYRKRGLANGLVFAAGGFGGAAISFAFDALSQNLGIGWAFRLMGICTLVTGIPAAWFITERHAFSRTGFVDWSLMRSAKFLLIFLAGVLATFPLFVPPFFLPLYSKSIGFSSSTGAGLVAGFNLSSAAGRILCGLLCDYLGSQNVLFLSLLLTSLSMLVLWPLSNTLGPMIVFVVLNGVSNGGFFAIMPTVVANAFGSNRVSIAMGMVVTGWVGGYLMGSPIAGYILEAYGGTDKGMGAYRPAMFYAGSMAAAATLSAATVRFLNNRNVLAVV